MEYSNDLPPCYEEVVNAPCPSAPLEADSSLLGASASTATADSSSAPKPTMTRYPNFNVKSDVRAIYDALQCCSYHLIISILCRRTYDQRMEISKIYSELIGRSLVNDISFKSMSDLQLLFVGLTQPYYEFFVNCIESSEKLAWVPYIMLTMTNDEINKIKNLFRQKYSEDLIKYIERFIEARTHTNQQNDTYVLKPLLTILEARRNESEIVSLNEVSCDAERIANIKPKSFFGAKKDEKEYLKEFLFFKSFSHIRAVFDLVLKKYNLPFMNIIKHSGFSYGYGILTVIVKYALNKSYYFAHLLNIYNCQLDSNHHLLIHVVLRRSEIDLADVKAEYQKLYEKSLQNMILKTTSNDFKQAIYIMMDEPFSS